MTVLINVKIDLNLPQYAHSAAIILHLRYNGNVATKY